MVSFNGKSGSCDIIMRYLWLFVFLFLSFWQGTALGKSSDEWESELEDAPSFEDKVKKMKIKSVSDLRHLAPFDDIAVIQKRFLPKTFRGEAGLSLLSILNNKFFYLAGGEFRLGYFIREKHGLGLQGYAIYNWEKLISSRLRVNQAITAYNTIAPRFFIGGYYKWTPVYGKFSFMNRKIQYFDIFFNFGGGVKYIVSAIPKNISASGFVKPVRPWAPASRLSTGQVFALSKDFGATWEFTWYFYLYELLGVKGFRFRHDLSFSIGFNYYFPGVSER